MIGYIYIITNKITGKQYVGQTRRTITIRFNQHKTRAISKKDNMYLHIAMNKYGVENFTVKEITHIEFDDKNQLLNDKEIMSVHCYRCGKNLKKKVKWISPNGKHYYAIAYCFRHGYVKSKLRIKKSEDGGVYAVKTDKCISSEEVKILREKYNAMKEMKKQKKEEKK